jgi:nucleoid-associated protein YgaU
MTVTLVWLAGCQEPQNDEDLQEPEAQSAMMEADYYTTDPAATTTDDSFAQTYPAETTTLSQTPTDSGSLHVVVKGDTLFGLARQYYSDERRWKDIWEANRQAVPNPDVIHVGQKLVIP